MNSLVKRRMFSTAQSLGPSLHNIPQRWTKLKELEQADIVDYLSTKAAGSWTNLSIDEKRAMYYVYYGEWGPRSTKPAASISGTLLKGLFSGVLFISFGVSLFNYAIDEEHKERLEKTKQEVLKLKEQEQTEKLVEQNKRTWWFWK